MWSHRLVPTTVLVRCVNYPSMWVSCNSWHLWTWNHGGSVDVARWKQSSGASRSGDDDRRETWVHMVLRGPGPVTRPHPGVKSRFEWMQSVAGARRRTSHGVNLQRAQSCSLTASQAPVSVLAATFTDSPSDGQSVIRRGEYMKLMMAQSI